MLLLQKTSFDFIPFLYFVIIFQRHASLPGITENTIPSFISHLPSSEKAFSHEDSGAVPLKLLCITSTAPGHIESSCAPSPSVTYKRDEMRPEIALLSRLLHNIRRTSRPVPTHLAPFSNQSFPWVSVPPNNWGSEILIEFKKSSKSKEIN